MIDGLYVFGETPVHRIAPGWKLLALVLLGTILFLFESWWVLLPIVLFVALGYRLAGLKPTHALGALRPLWWILAAIFVVQIIFADPATAFFVIIRLAVLILAATLVTLTTRTSEFVDAIHAGLAHAPDWVPGDKIALAIAMTFRFIPRIRTQFLEIRDAQRARGLERNPVALLVPLIVRTLKDADDIARAIEARSVD